MTAIAEPAYSDLINDVLIARARHDRDAFGRLYDACYPMVYRYCLRRLFVRDVAEDLTSEVFLQVAKHLPHFEPPTRNAFIAWLYTIATNQVNSYLRKRIRRKQLLDLAVHQKVLGSLSSTQDNTEHHDWPTVYLEIAKLKPQDQSIITLRFFEDLPHDRIAEILNLKPTTVRVRLTRILAKLRKNLNIEIPAKKRRINNA